jgi:hypothetical protein
MDRERRRTSGTELRGRRSPEEPEPSPDRSGNGARIDRLALERRQRVALAGVVDLEAVVAGSELLAEAEPGEQPRVGQAAGKEVEAFAAGDLVENREALGELGPRKVELGAPDRSGVAGVRRLARDPDRRIDLVGRSEESGRDETEAGSENGDGEDEPLEPPYGGEVATPRDRLSII